MIRSPTRLRVSIDGASATGKTTLGLGLARARQAAFLDTGLTFRAGALLLSKDADAIRSIETGNWLMSFTHEPARFAGERQEPERVLLDGQDVTELIRTPDIDPPLRALSTHAGARAALQIFHRGLISNEQRAIVAGRDVGVSLLPDADLSVVLTADLEVRRSRRRDQYAQKLNHSREVTDPSTLDLEVMGELARSGRAVIIDTTTLSPAAVFERTMHELKQRIA